MLHLKYKNESALAKHYFGMNLENIVGETGAQWLTGHSESVAI